MKFSQMVMPYTVHVRPITDPAKVRGDLSDRHDRHTRLRLRGNDSAAARCEE